MFSFFKDYQPSCAAKSGMERCLAKAYLQEDTFYVTAYSTWYSNNTNRTTRGLYNAFNLPEMK